MAVKNLSHTNPDFPMEIQSTETALKDWAAQFVSKHMVEKPKDQHSKLILYGNDYLKYLETSISSDTGPRLGALCLTQPFTGSYIEMYAVGIRHLIYRTYPLADQSLELAVAEAQNSDSKITEHCSKTESDFYKRIQILSDINETMNSAEQLVMEVGFEAARSQSIRLCLKEAVTNAIFHGFRNAGSHDRKYLPETFQQMEGDDSVTLCLRKTGNWLIALIKDNSGILGPLSVVNSLDRHHSNRGLLDERGRGFYLMHHLAQRMIVSIVRQKQTSIELHFAIDEASRGPHHFQLLVE